MAKSLRGFLAIVGFLATLPFAAQATTIGFTTTTFAVGSLPEDIIPVLSTFGSAPAGSYLVTDPTQNFTGTGTVWSVPAGGGTPTSFLNLGTIQPIGGLFLPSAYGANAGNLLLAGLDTNTGFATTIVYNSSGLPVSPDGVVETPGTSRFADVAIAPAGFDSAGGDVIMANEDGSLYVLNPADLSASLLAGGTLPTGNSEYPFGLAFAPGGFGSEGGDLLITSGQDGSIYELSPTGNLSLFTTVPLGPGQVGLRQLAFAPAGFGAYGGDLMVSVSGSTTGGGIAGSVDVLDSSGNVIAYLSEGTVGNPYDPRGIYFAGTSQVLINNADPGVIAAAPSQFTLGNPASVPEPSTALLVLLGLPLLRFAKSAKRSRS